LPLLACATAGIGGFLTSRRSSWAFALLAGCAVLFRYSGLCVIPLVLLAGLLYKKWFSALFCLIPLGLLLAHDWQAYGELHLLAMSEFQAVSNGPEEVFLKGVALLAMLGGVGLLPFLSWSGRAPWGLGIGAVLGALGAYLCGMGAGGTMAVILFSSSGALAFTRLGFTSKEDLLISTWAIGGAVFLLGLRFAAARYWLPFLPAFVLAALRVAPSSRRLGFALGLSVLLALGLSVDDRAFARAQRNAALQVNTYGEGSFAGHWGFQYHMEALGWRPLEEGGPIDRLHAVFLQGWPQAPSADQCLLEKGRFTVADRFWGPRSHSFHPPANLHSNWLASDPPSPSLMPWSLSSEPYVEIALYEACP
jgi:hypothetical protein